MSDAPPLRRRKNVRCVIAGDGAAPSEYRTSTARRRSPGERRVSPFLVELAHEEATTTPSSGKHAESFRSNLNLNGAGGAAREAAFERSDELQAGGHAAARRVTIIDIESVAILETACDNRERSRTSTVSFASVARAVDVGGSDSCFRVFTFDEGAFTPLTLSLFLFRRERRNVCSEFAEVQSRGISWKSERRHRRTDGHTSRASERRRGSRLSVHPAGEIIARSSEERNAPRERRLSLSLSRSTVGGVGVCTSEIQTRRLSRDTRGRACPPLRSPFAGAFPSVCAENHQVSRLLPPSLPESDSRRFADERIARSKIARRRRSSDVRRER